MRTLTQALNFKTCIWPKKSDRRPQTFFKSARPTCFQVQSHSPLRLPSFSPNPFSAQMLTKGLVLLSRRALSRARHQLTKCRTSLLDPKDPITKESTREASTWWLLMESWNGLSRPQKSSKSSKRRLLGMSNQKKVLKMMIFAVTL